MDCDEAFDLLSSDESVPADKKAALDAHLAGCVQCLREAQGLDDFEDALRHPEDHESTPPAVREAILARVKARRAWSKLRVGLLVVVAAALVVGGILIARRSELAVKAPDGPELDGREKK